MLGAATGMSVANCMVVSPLNVHFVMLFSAVRLSAKRQPPNHYMLCSNWVFRLILVGGFGECNSFLNFFCPLGIICEIARFTCCYSEKVAQKMYRKCPGNGAKAGLGERGVALQQK